MVDLSEILRRLPEIGAPALRDLPAARSAAAPFIAGEAVPEAVAALASAQAQGYVGAVQYLPGPGDDASSRLVHLQLISALALADVAPGSDLTVSLAGLTLPHITPAERTDLVATIRAAQDAGMTVTLAGLVPAAVPAVLDLHAELVADSPDLGITLAAALQRSEADCRDLATAGTRVRLVKRAGRAAEGEAHLAAHDIDKAYVRCLRHLIDGGARTTVATEDPRLLEITAALVERADEPAEHGFLFRRGLEPEDSARLLAEGATVAVLQPFGPGWVDYLGEQVAPSVASMGKAARSALGMGRAS